MDADISGWVWEFLLQQPIRNETLNKLLTKLPIPNNNPHLKKCFLLRAIKDGTVSEDTLEMLESIEAIDKESGKGVPESMKKAYMAAALECATKEGEESGRYMEAVERVWRERIGRLEERGSELVTEELRKLRDEVEASLWDDATRKRLLERKEGAAALVGGYLEEASVEPFLVLAARMTREQSGVQINPAGEAKEKESGSHSGGDVRGVLEKKKHAVRFKHAATGYRRSKGRVRIGCSEDDETESASKHSDTLPPTPEVEKVQEALKTSCLELKAVVKDPLPDALKFAATLTVETEREVLQQNISVGNQCEKVLEESNSVVEKQNGKEVNAPNPPVEEVVEPGKAVESSGVISSCSHQNNVSKPSLMDRNETAQTYEWDDLSDGSPDGTSDGRRLHLHTTERKLASPLKTYQPAKLTRRRKLKKWSLEEEDALRDGVQKFGRGNWKLILNSKRDIFVERTEVDLKDKWRNLTR